MTKKTTLNFEETLKELENIVQHLENGDLALDDALNEFETAMKLVQQGQNYLQKAEQRIQILMQKSETAPLTSFQNEEEDIYF